MATIVTSHVSRAARLLLLYRLREQDILVGWSLAEIGEVFGTDRSTIYRDLKILDVVEAEYNRLAEALAFERRWLTATEFAERLGVRADTVRAMIRDGLIAARKRRGERSQGGQWAIPLSELERFKRKEAMVEPDDRHRCERCGAPLPASASPFWLDVGEAIWLCERCAAADDDDNEGVAAD